VSFAGAGFWVKAGCRYAMKANARNNTQAEIRAISVRLMSGHYIKFGAYTVTNEGRM